MAFVRGAKIRIGRRGGAHVSRGCAGPSTGGGDGIIGGAGAAPASEGVRIGRRTVGKAKATAMTCGPIENRNMNYSGKQPRNSPANTLRVAVDIDDVLAHYLPVINSYYNKMYDTNHSVADYFIYDYKQIWKCSPDESNERVHKFYQSYEFLNEVKPIAGAFESIERLSTLYDLVVVTSRQLAIEEPTISWIGKHFPGMFSDIHFGNAYALTGVSRTKGEICAEIGADILIDDNPGYVRECAAAGMETVLFDLDCEYAWNKEIEDGEHCLITRLSSWQQVEAKINEIARRRGLLVHLD